MSDLRSALDREGKRFDLAPGALERVLDRRRRRSQRRRAGAIAVGLVIGGLAVWAAVSLGGLGKRPTIPAHPTPGLEGTWQTGRLTERQVVQAFVAAGGAAQEGHAFFAQLGGGAKRYAVITLRFDNGTFVEFENADGNAPVIGYEATYTVKQGILTIASPRCTGTYSFRVEGQRLRLHLIHQCARHDGVYNTTLFTSFAFARQG